VKVDIPHPRARATIFQNPAYHKTRDYLVDFLVNRSGSALPEQDGSPKVVEPAKGTAQPEPAEPETESETAARAVNA
jgi:nitrate/nitrite transport system ATP-binding protein